MRMRSLETPRLVLRPYRIEDWQHVHRYASIPEFSQYDVWGPNSVEDTKRFVGDCIAHLGRDPAERYDLAIELKASGAFAAPLRSAADPKRYVSSTKSNAGQSH